MTMRVRVGSATQPVLLMLRTGEVLTKMPAEIAELLDVAEKLQAAQRDRLRSGGAVEFNLHVVADEIITATREKGEVPNDLEDRVSTNAISAEERQRLLAVLDDAINRTTRDVETAVREHADELIATQVQPKFTALMETARGCMQELAGCDLRAQVDEVFRWPTGQQDALRQLTGLAEEFGRIRACHLALTTTQSSDGFWARQLIADSGEIIRPDLSKKLRTLLRLRPDQQVGREVGNQLPGDHRYRLEILASLPAKEVWCPTVEEMKAAQAALVQRLRPPAPTAAQREAQKRAAAELDRKIAGAKFRYHLNKPEPSSYVSPFDE